MYFLSQDFHSVKEENENLRKENRSSTSLYMDIDGSEPTKYNEHTSGEN